MATNPRLPVISDCQGCGVCCMHMGYPAFMDPVESSFDADYWASMPADLRNELADYISSYQPPAAGELDGPCVWFDMETRQCKHHQYRPRVCRDFPTGGSGCLSWRWHYRHLIKSSDTPSNPSPDSSTDSSSDQSPG